MPYHLGTSLRVDWTILQNRVLNKKTYHVLYNMIEYIGLMLLGYYS